MMKKISIRQIEKRMDEISHKMAGHFNEHVTAASLSKWLAQTGNLCVKYPPEEELIFPPLDFLHNIGWSLLPNLIECRKSNDSILVIKKELIWLFQCEGYFNTKIALSEIGYNYLKDFLVCNYEPMEFYELTNIHTTWVFLVNMFSEYEFLEKQLELKAE